MLSSSGQRRPAGVLAAIAMRLGGPLVVVADWAHRHEPVRRSLQTVVAVAIAYAAAVLLRLPEPSWAVFSALFVVQDTVGGTVTSALNRILGAAVGLALGLAVVLVVGIGPWRSLVALILAVGVMAGIAGRWPHLQYGLVTVAILVVAPSYQLLEGALVTALEIAVGAVCGAAAGAGVLPVAAHRSAARHLAQATRCCGQLLERGMTAIVRNEPPALLPQHQQVEAELTRARELMLQSRRSRHDRSGRLFDLYRRLDRLWYTLALVDRISSMHLPEAAAPMTGPIRKATVACCVYLQHLADAIESGERPPDAAEPLAVTGQVAAAIESLREQDSLRSTSRAELEAVLTLSFAWQQVSTSVAALARCVAGEDEDA